MKRCPNCGYALGMTITARELEVLVLLDTGVSNAAIGEALYISENTVKNHVRTITTKLGVRGRGRGVHAARALGLLDAKEDE